MVHRNSTVCLMLLAAMVSSAVTCSMMFWMVALEDFGAGPALKAMPVGIGCTSPAAATTTQRAAPVVEEEPQPQPQQEEPQQEEPQEESQQEQPQQEQEEEEEESEQDTKQPQQTFMPFRDSSGVCRQGLEAVRSQPFVDPRLVAEYRTSSDAQFDIVYTWVNGSDPEHLRNKARFGHKAAPDDRDSDHDELRFSMRSLDMYMPWWNGTLFFVSTTVPCWLDVSHPRLRLVQHKQYMMWHSKTLPTFNSEAIEAFFHRIPGLSERFVYMNDDVFLGRLMAPSDLFSNGTLMLWQEKKVVEHGRAEYESIRLLGGRMNSAKFAHTRGEMMVHFSNKFRKTVKLPFRQQRHGPLVLHKAVFSSMWKSFRFVLEATTKNRFRSVDDIAVMFMHHHYCLLDRPGLCQVVPDSRYSEGAYYGIGNLGDGGTLQMIRRLLFDPPLFFCMNDVRYEVQQAISQADEEAFWAYRTILPLLFPTPSQWETSVCSS